MEVGSHLLVGAGELRPLVLLPADVWLVREGVQRDMGGAGEPPGVGQSPRWEGRFGEVQGELREVDT